MRIGLYKPSQLHISIRHYIDNVGAELEAIGVKLVRFSKSDPLPNDVDFYWDPGAGRGGPHRRLVNSPYPLVVTFHGAANLVLPTKEWLGPGWRNFLIALKSRTVTKVQWALSKNRCAAIITVSNYAKREIAECLHLSEDIIFPVYHGVDSEVFHPKKENLKTTTTPYFLHISQGQPKKNVDRLVTAFSQLNNNGPLNFNVVASRFSISNPPEGLHHYQSHLDHTELAPLYQGALGFVFPSLHETFGMPILEAMASGCPVITSNTSGCAEVAGDAALLVDPRSTECIASAMHRLATDAGLRRALREKGLARARRFTWRKTAEQHMAVFKNLLEVQLG